MKIKGGEDRTRLRGPSERASGLELLAVQRGQPSLANRARASVQGPSRTAEAHLSPPDSG